MGEGRAMWTSHRPRFLAAVVCKLNFLHGLRAKPFAAGVLHNAKLSPFGKE